MDTIRFQIICADCAKVLVDGVLEETKRTQALLKKLLKNKHGHECCGTHSFGFPKLSLKGG